MNVVIRADASLYIGSGHIMRCLVLAEALKKQGHKVSFASRPQAGDLVQFVRDKGFHVYELVQALEVREPTHSADYLAWLQVPWLNDAQSLLEQCSNVDMLIVDHYGLDHEWEKLIHSAWKCKILIIDDLDREHDCDLILDQNLWRNTSERYQDSIKNKVLNGPEYALLRPKFYELRQSKDQPIDQVLVFFGGSDPTSECLKVVKALNQLGPIPFKVKLVTGNSNQDYDQIKAIINDNVCCLFKFIDNFEQELALSKYALGASGVSNWERLCLRVPTSVVSVADNQRELSEYLSELDIINYLGSGEETTPEIYKQELTRLANEWDDISPEAKVSVDGMGAQRVIEEIRKMFS